MKSNNNIINMANEFEAKLPIVNKKRDKINLFTFYAS